MTLKIKSISIIISFPAIALVTLIIVTNFLTNYLLCFIAIIIHESAHLIAMYICGSKPRAFEISLFDIKIIENNRLTLSFYKDIIITLSGPVINILMYFLFLYIDIPFAYVNLFLGLFNLLPCASLDGGQVIYLILSKRISERLTERIIDILTLITLFPIFVVGIIVLFNSNYNFSLLFLCLYLLLSLFIKKSKYL
ncbi:MAG: site-2 protease family protein [Ruminococcus sp.]